MPTETNEVKTWHREMQARRRRWAQFERLGDLEAAWWWAFKARMQARAAARVRTPYAAAFVASSCARSHAYAIEAMEPRPPGLVALAPWVRSSDVR